MKMERDSRMAEEKREEMDYKKICPGCMKERSNPAGPCEFCGYDPSVRGQAEDTLEPGSLLAGRYLTGRVLGRGGFGITYLGMDLQLQVRVAVKELFLRSVTLRERESGQVLAAGGKESLFASCRGRFLREARVLAMLDEKDAEGIVTVREYFEENGTAYIVMEYIEGMTLREKIGREGWMDYREMMACIRPFCHAVIKIHSFNVVHKDISPENIMITPEGRVRLLDFGVACGPDPDPEGVPVHTAAAGITETVFPGFKVFLEDTVIFGPAVRTADTVDIYAQIGNTEILKKVVRQQDQFCISGRLLRTETFQAKLMVFSQTSVLWVFIPEDRGVQVIHLAGKRFCIKIAFKKTAYSAGSSFRFQCNGTLPFILERIHLLLHDIRCIADTAKKQFSMFKYRRTHFAVSG